MKRTATLFVFLLLTLSSKGKHTIFRDDFEKYAIYTIDQGWQHEKSGYAPWRAAIPYLVSGPCFGIPDVSQVACIAEPCTPLGSGNNNNVLMYRQVDLTGFSKVWLSYDSYFRRSGTPPEKATVEVSVNSGATWTVIQDVPANPDPRIFTSYYIDLSAYANVSNLLVGFRYSDVNSTRTGWAIDNVEIFSPANKDLALVSVTPAEALLSYCETGKGILHKGTVFNTGLDTVYSFLSAYQQDAGPVYTHNVTGVVIPPFTYYTFTHSIPDTVWTQGEHVVTMSAELTGDQYNANDLQTIRIRGAAFIPKKRVTIEHGSATWNAYAPRGLHLLDQAGKDMDVCPIIVHDQDPMELPSYSDYLYHLHNQFNYTPYYMFDRRRNVHPDSFDFYINRQKEYFGYGDIYADVLLNGSTLTVNTHVTPAINMTGDYRLTVIINEDGVTGNDSGYAQKNVYAGGSLGPMGGYENKPNPVPAADMIYDFVARKVIPSTVGGQQGKLPANMLSNETQHYIFSTEMEPGWGKKMRATVLLLDVKEDIILNSFRTMFYLDVPTVEKNIIAGVYPNPAGSHASIYFEQDRNKQVQVMVTDMMGRKLWGAAVTTEKTGRSEINIPTSQLPSGLYIVNMMFEDGRASQKLRVVH